MKSRKLLAGLLITALVAVNVTQAAFAAEYWAPINKQEDVPAGNITIEQPLTSDGVYGVMPTENITLNGDLTITVPASTAPTDKAVGVYNETIETNDFTVQTKNIVIQAADSVDCIAIGVSEAGGKTIVDGNITADTYGIEYSNGTVICTGTVQGGDSAIAVTTSPGDIQNDSIVVYELKGGTEGLITFTGDVGEGESPTEDAFISKINYIIKKSGATDAITFSEGVRQVEGYDTAHSGDTIKIKLTSGYEFGSSNTVKAVLQADGSYLVTVPRTGGVTLSAILQAVTVAEESGSSAPATTKEYTDEQLRAAVAVYGGTLVNSSEELAKELAQGTKVLFVPGELMKDTAAAEALFAALKAGRVKAYKVMDNGTIMSSAVKSSQMEYENCGNVKTLDVPAPKLKEEAESVESSQPGSSQGAGIIAPNVKVQSPSGNKTLEIEQNTVSDALVSKAPNPALLYDQSAGALFTNEFTKTTIKEAGIESVILKNEALNLTVPVDNLTSGGTAGMTTIPENKTVKKVILDNICLDSLNNINAKTVPIGQENIRVNFVSPSEGNIRFTVTIPEGTNTANFNLVVQTNQNQNSWQLVVKNNTTAN